MKKILLICLLPLGASLLNTDYFGSQSLTAYFGYTILAFFSAMCMGILLLRQKAPYGRPGLRVPVTLLLCLALYVFVHGLITHTLGLAHYYWMAAAIWFWTMSRWPSLPGMAANKFTAFAAISLLASLESLVVLFQWLHWIPVKNDFFACTGTWINPNVTALFLAMSVYAILRTLAVLKRPGLAYVSLGLVLLAIALLQCRSAYLAASLFLVARYGSPVKDYLSRRLRLHGGIFIAGAIAASLLLVLALSFRLKQASTRGRIQIWQNSLALIARKPLTGQGFGLFERQYNLFAAENKFPGNDHVNMPYNDFLELGIEGGLIAPLLWLAFLISAGIESRKNKGSLSVLLAFAIIQLTNFGFQAIPAFVLFLLYIAWADRAPVVAKSNAGPIATVPLAGTRLAPVRLPGLAFVSFLVFLLLLRQLNLAKAFHQRAEIAANDPTGEAIDAYRDLGPQLNGFSAYHESFGDAWLQLKQYKPALAEYLAAAQKSSLPALLIKCGYCYQQQKQYDSSEYYYSIVRDMQPARFSPRMALLNLYRQKGDTPRMLCEAKEIVGLPVRSESLQVTEMKADANRLLTQNGIKE